MALEEQLLFVYGTLKRGHGNHHHLLGATYAGEAVIAGVVLHDLGPFPMAVPGEGQTHGELFRVDGASLARLDRFEGVPRLYGRCRLPLSDGRQAWIYLGRPRQVRHSPRLMAGRWPAGEQPARAAQDQRAPSWRLGLLACLLSAALLPPLSAPTARADVNLAQCQRWRSSSGVARILEGNAIGAAAYLTKVRPFAESPPQAPELLYAPADLERVCDGWR